MIKKRLLSLSSDSMRHILQNVMWQWLGLLVNVVMMLSAAKIFELLYQDAYGEVIIYAAVILSAIPLKAACIKLAAKKSYLASKSVKKVLREQIYSKLLRLGPSYTSQVSTAEVVQVSVEGVDQLETYFGAYLPQLFYSMLAPLTLFFLLAPISLRAAAVLFICVPLIPVSIVLVQKIAKRLLNRYWGQYAKLGDSFLENLQGLTTLKIYQADARKHREMNREAENFRRVTMKVLSMQLNSIIVMDVVALGGAALGMVLALREMAAGHVSIFGTLAILLLAADFFLPMRQLGSYFHIAMNGMAASDKIFKILDLSESLGKGEIIPNGDVGIEARKVSFRYGEQPALKEVELAIPHRGMTAFVGRSGCGKSTLASVISGRLEGYEGSFTIGGKELAQTANTSLLEKVTVVSMNSYLFGGTVRENLLAADPGAEEKKLWEVLEKVRLADFLREQQGLDTILNEAAANISGGQRQRLALARALLHDSPIYIFDEATSNIDVESETRIMELVYELARTKTVLLISHRLANVTGADRIYAMEKGRIVGCGRHEKLLQSCGIYRDLWNQQQELEYYVKEETEEWRKEAI